MSPFLLWFKDHKSKLLKVFIIATVDADARAHADADRDRDSMSATHVTIASSRVGRDAARSQRRAVLCASPIDVAGTHEHNQTSHHSNYAIVRVLADIMCSVNM
jgi:hypothetical protein